MRQPELRKRAPLVVSASDRKVGYALMAQARKEAAEAAATAAALRRAPHPQPDAPPAAAPVQEPETDALLQWLDALPGSSPAPTPPPGTLVFVKEEPQPASNREAAIPVYEPRPLNETKHAAFLRLAPKRMATHLHYFEANIVVLAAKERYDYTPQEARAFVDALYKMARDAEQAFAEGGKRKLRASFDFSGS